MDINTIAKICHNANKAYCECTGDFSQPTWENADFEIKASAVNGVQYHIDNPNATPEKSHANWMKTKKEQGWTYGEVKDEAIKKHPCMVDYDDLPEAQQIKDKLFSAIVTVCKEKKNANTTK
jgi:hypothetical protein